MFVELECCMYDWAWVMGVLQKEWLVDGVARSVLFLVLAPRPKQSELR